MSVEATTTAATPKELYDKILAVEPYTGCGFLKPCPLNKIQRGDGSGVFQFADPSVLKNMPLWKWNDLANFTKVLKA